MRWSGLGSSSISDHMEGAASSRGDMSRRDGDSRLVESSLLRLSLSLTHSPHVTSQICSIKPRCSSVRLRLELWPLLLSLSGCCCDSASCGRGDSFGKPVGSGFGKPRQLLSSACSVCMAGKSEGC